MLLNIGFLFLAAILLWLGANWIVNSASLIARKFNVSELVIGLTIVALGTSAPEFLVTFNAAWRGHNDISLSNVVGSNIFNLGFILGLMAIIKPMTTRKIILYRDGMLLFASTIVIMLVAMTGELSRLFGGGLVALLIVYLIYLGFQREAPGEGEVDHMLERQAKWYDWFILIAGFAAISGGGHLMVSAAKSIATEMGVSDWVIGMTIVAAGTSLPELVTCLAASMKGRNEMLLGNLIGSDFFNFAGVLGVTCLIKPLTVGPEAMNGLYALVFMVGLVMLFLRTNWRIGRLEGALLIGINLLRWAKDFMA